jgi:peptide/nickel transport system substrate-binding protein
MRTLLALLLLLSGAAQAQELRIGMKAAVDGSDPHQSYSPNRNVQLHVYEPLYFQDSNLHPIPGLAETGRPIAPTVWEFRLRPGVTFHDGSPLTAADVIFSVQRAKDAQGLRTYASLLRSITAMEAVDDQTLRITTSSPTPMLPAYLTSVGIVSAAATGSNAAETEFNGGRAAIGTGPYRWVRFSQGDSVVIERAPHYWGPPEPWQRVTYRFIPNDSARVAALLAGDVDVIDAVPPSLYARVRSDPRSQLVTAVSGFNFYMSLDSSRAVTPFVTGEDGRPLDRNPLRDLRVRRALSHAINREALAARSMEGGAVAAGQIAPAGFIGNDPDLPLPAYDPALARRLLAEAGYPRGFGLTIQCTADRFAGDIRSCQAIGQMFTAIGIRTTVEGLPTAVFFRRARGPGGVSEFSAALAMFFSTTGVATEGMNTLLRTENAALGHGPQNRGGYSDSVLDGLLAEAEREMDDAGREALTRRAVRRVMEQAALVPVFFVQSGWGTRRGLTLTPRGDQYTMATGIRLAP